MEESYLMSDSVTASTFIVTPDGELITFEEYQKTKTNGTSKLKPDETPEIGGKAQSFLHEFQHQALSSDTIRNMLRNENSSLVSKDLIAGFSPQCPRLDSKDVKIEEKNGQQNVPNGVLNGNFIGISNGISSGISNGISNDISNNVSNDVQPVQTGDSHVSTLLHELNDENLTNTQHTRADRIYKELLSDLSDLTNFNAQSQELTGQLEIDLLRHTNMYLTQIQHEVLSLKRKLSGDITNDIAN